MDYEKAYKEALNRAKLLKDNPEKVVIEKNNGSIHASEYIFPELEESEDEKIRKTISDILLTDSDEIREILDANNVSMQDIDAWLEKQESVGEIVERCKDSWYNEGKLQGKIEGLSDEEKYQQGWHDALEKQGEQKPVEKTEPKFNVGDWVSVGGHTILISDIRNDLYEAIFTNGEHRVFDTNVLDKEGHLWAIDDAEDGDVLAAHECLVVFEKIDGLNIRCHCTYHLGFNPNFSIYTLQYFHPAIKEQCDILFTKMKEAGYTWDSEKKELRRLTKKNN